MTAALLQEHAVIGVQVFFAFL